MLAFVQIIAAQWDLAQEDRLQAIDRAEKALTLAQLVYHPSTIALAGSLMIEANHQLGHLERSQQVFVELQHRLQDGALSTLAQQRLSDVEALLKRSLKLVVLVRAR